MYGLVRRVVRDPAQSEEVTKEVLVEIRRSAPRYDPTLGSVRTWARDGLIRLRDHLEVER